jgi:hypothetical protein
MMNRMRLPFIATLALGVVFVGMGWPAAESADQAKLAGDPGPGPYIHGCVDCHTEGGAENIGSLLRTMRHPSIGDLKVVPDGCAECHSADGKGEAGPLSEAMHVAHFDKPLENAFIKDFGGNCLHCHSLDAKTGEVSVKSGPKNW